MADEKLLSVDEQLQLAREQFETAKDFTVAVEEEFAILDPETLSLANRFEDARRPLQKGKARGASGELIASEVEIRTGRCNSLPRSITRIASGGRS